MKSGPSVLSVVQFPWILNRFPPRTPLFRPIPFFFQSLPISQQFIYPTLEVTRPLPPHKGARCSSDLLICPILTFLNPRFVSAIKSRRIMESHMLSSPSPLLFFPGSTQPSFFLITPPRFVFIYFFEIPRLIPKLHCLFTSVLPSRSPIVTYF